jgi:hypothetical protein
MNSDTKEAVRFFYKLLIDQKNRLEYGSQDRERIKTQIENDQSPTGYRVDWILSSSNKVILLLGEMSREFNNTYPDDKISSDDFLDVLTTAIKKIKNAIKKEE